MVSVIVPIFNAENYIDTCVSHLLTQTYKDLEILLIDDCSTDESGLKCDKYAQEDCRVKVFHFSINKGPSAARNYGISKAQGEWIIFVDADDWLEKRCVEEVLKYAYLYSADVVIWNLINHIGNKEIYEKALEGKERIFQGSEISYLQNMLLTMRSETGTSALELTGPVCKLYKVDLLNNLFFPEDINFGEDICFVMQVFQAAQKIVYIEGFFYHRTVLKNSLSYKIDYNISERRLQCVNWMINYCKDVDIGTPEAWNNFIYNNFKLIINLYIHVFPTFRQYKSYKKIRYFLQRLIVPLNINKAFDEDPKIKELLQRGWYYRYKVYFVYKNIKEKIKRYERPRNFLK